MLGSGTMVTPSTNYIMVTPGVMPTSSEAVVHDSTFMTQNIGASKTVGAMVPIGSERAQKSAAQPVAAFPGICVFRSHHLSIENIYAYIYF